MYGSTYSSTTYIALRWSARRWLGREGYKHLAPLEPEQRSVSADVFTTDYLWLALTVSNRYLCELLSAKAYPAHWYQSLTRKA
jgi:hypothetical protein